MRIGVVLSVRVRRKRVVRTPLLHTYYIAQYIVYLSIAYSTQCSNTIVITIPTTTAPTIAPSTAMAV